jgi:hypothetical protein
MKIKIKKDFKRPWGSFLKFIDEIKIEGKYGRK